MGTLIKYELRKILGNRAGMVACVLALAMVAGLAVLNLGTMVTFDYDTGKRVEGFAAQAAYKHAVGQSAGTLTDERVAADMAVLERAHELAGSVEDFDSLSSTEMISRYGLDFYRDTMGVMVSDYYNKLQNAIEASAEPTDSLQVGARARLDLDLDLGFMGYFGYSDAERDYWHAKQDQVGWPIAYGYAVGWKNTLDYISFLGLAVIALCIALSGVFAGEYQSRTAAVVLPTRRGKRALPVAKACAALIFATAYWWLCAAVLVGINVAVCGADGWGLPMQAIFSFSNPYPLTVGQTVLAAFVLGYLIALGMTALTLLLSAKMRSTMPVAVIPMAVTFLGRFALFITPLAKVAVFTPLAGLNYSFNLMASYAVGPVVLDLPSALALLYACLLVACVPLAMQAFRRHQVA